MPELNSFDDYLQAIEASLRHLPPGERASIRQELLAHLEDAAAEQGRPPGDPTVQHAVMATLGPVGVVAAAYSRAHGGGDRWLRLFSLLAGALGGVLSMAGAILPHGGGGTTVYMLLVALAGAVGIIGAGMRFLHWRGGLALLLGSSAVLLGLGGYLLYGINWSVAIVTGACAMIGGQLLLASAAVYYAQVGLSLRQFLACMAGLLLLVSFVSPFSSLPNPLGLYYIMRGGYYYDPASSLLNRFAILPDGEVTPPVTARLEQLIGKTGLEPLDPHQPLQSYRVLGVLNGGRFNYPQVEVELIYADRASRRYMVPATDGGNWKQTGLDRLAAPHMPLRDLPPAGADSPVQLGQPVPVPLPAATRQLLQSMWLTASTSTDITWSPTGLALLLRLRPGLATLDDAVGIWLVPLDGAAPHKLIAHHKQALEPDAGAWNGDGTKVVWLQNSGPLGSVWEPTIVAYDVASGAEQQLATTDWGQVAVVGNRVYFMQNNVLWRVGLDGQSLEQLATLPDAEAPLYDSPLAVSPDETRVAYRCAGDLCLASLDGRMVARVTTPYEKGSQQDDTVSLRSFGLAWSADSQQLAFTTAAYNARRWPELRLVSRDGQLERDLDIGPDGALDPPQWTPDGRMLLFTAYPGHGRRIVAVEVASGRVFDLSQPGWDAFARMSPDGSQLLLWNGRGGLWLVPLEKHNS
ncbi:MAG: hypothetical protein MUD01_06175 [Chloroflexaceae bacterium]|nr:hypothetical protein [Chloroflexaceae bacterium]